MRKKVLITTGVVILAIGGYMVTGIHKDTESNAIDAQNIKQLVSSYSSGSMEAQSASITSQTLIVTGNDAKTVSYNLPKNEFFLSIAPYVNKTHPCETHSLTGCQGEMVEEDFNVSIVDKEGNEILNKPMRSQPNGFIDLWLPRNKTYHIKIEQNGKTAESEVSTFNSDNTCITTMQIL
mgnify:CR=1 FL=1